MTWHKLTNEGGVFHCDTNGHNCLTHVFPDDPAFPEPKMKKEMQDEVHDESLVELTRKVNQLLHEAAQSRSDRNLRLTKTSRGIVIIWTHKSASGSTDAPELTDNEMLEVFGLV